MRNAVRITTAVAFAVMLMAALAPAVVQAGPAAGGQGTTSFNIYGWILALDEGAGTIQLQVVTPEYLLKDNPLTVQTTANTQFRQCDAAGNSFAIGFADLEVGRAARIMGDVLGDVRVATRVIQYVID
jgi:opacity protein-like surface antigen